MIASNQNTAAAAADGHGITKTWTRFTLTEISRSSEDDALIYVIVSLVLSDSFIILLVLTHFSVFILSH